MKVLLVCDNPRVATQAVSALLGDPDLVVSQALTPRRALSRLDDGEAYDVVIADADMVPTGGFALSREIKARGQMGEDVPPVVLLIARPEDRWLSDWSQADAHVQKPVDPFDLAETARAVAAGDPLPQLPGVGGRPTPSLLDVPGPEYETEIAETSVAPQAARGERA